jgi:hypothetical protein
MTTLRASTNTLLGAVSILVLQAALPAVAAAALTPAQKCAAGKNLAAGKYAGCRHKAERSLLRSGDTTKYATAIAKCNAKLAEKWQKLEQAALEDGATCATSGDQAAISAFARASSDTAVTALAAGGALPRCGDSSVNAPGEQCDGADLGGASCITLGFSQGSLGCSPACRFDVSACSGNCTGGRFPATGQSLCWDAGGQSIACAGSGQDGERQSGTPRGFGTDPAAGTITDGATQLVWEIKDDAGGLHDKDTLYSWTDAVTVHIDRLNNRCAGDGTTACGTNADCNGIGNGLCGHGGHRDWRLPNVYELRTLVDLSGTAASFPAFQSGCSAGCSASTCSCTGEYAASTYWSASTSAQSAGAAWSVTFSSGTVEPFVKTAAFAVRGVRGGL